MKRQLALALAILLLAGCGGGGGSTPGTPAAPAQAKTANGSVVISIPTGAAAGTSARVRYPQFVSPNASSVTLSINGGPNTLYDVSTSSSLCTTVSGTRNCTLSFGAPVGSDTFAFLIYQGANGTGAQLASASSTQTIAAGMAFNFTVALNATVGTIVANFTPPNSGNCPNSPAGFNGLIEGCGGAATLTFTVDDPSGALITGTAPYAAPINLTTSDPALTVSPAQITAPGQTATLTYSGTAFAAGVTNNASVNMSAGANGGSLTFFVRRSYLYVANANAPPGSSVLPGGGNVAVYQFGASSGTPPVRVISGSNTGLNTPVKPLVDANGTLYVLDNGTTSSAIYNPSIEVFAAGATNNAVPIRTISNMGAGPVTGNMACTDMTFDPTGNYLFVACGTIIVVFPTSANGAATSVVSDEMQDDDLAEQTGLAFDPSGDLYISDDSYNRIDIVSAPLGTTGSFHFIGGAHSLAPTASWPTALLPFGIAVDNSGALYAPLAGSAAAELGIWSGSALPCTNCAPGTILTGAPFSAGTLIGIALDPAGNAYVVNPANNNISEFSRATVTGASSSTPAVLRTLNNSATGASGGVGLTVGP